MAFKAHAPLPSGRTCPHCWWVVFWMGLLVKGPNSLRTVVFLWDLFLGLTFRKFRRFTKPSEPSGFHLNQNPNFEPFMVLHITRTYVSCLDIIPSGSLLTLCPLNKTEQLVGDQNMIQGSPPMVDLSSTTTTLIKDQVYGQPLFHRPLDVFSRQIVLSHSCCSPLLWRVASISRSQILTPWQASLFMLAANNDLCL